MEPRRNSSSLTSASRRSVTASRCGRRAARHD
jgi:hypothetical protein